MYIIISLKDIRVNTGETQGHLSVVFTAEVLRKGKERKCLVNTTSFPHVTQHWVRHTTDGNTENLL